MGASVATMLAMAVGMDPLTATCKMFVQSVCGPRGLRVQSGSAWADSSAASRQDHVLESPAAQAHCCPRDLRLFRDDARLHADFNSQERAVLLDVVSLSPGNVARRSDHLDSLCDDVEQDALLRVSPRAESRNVLVIPELAHALGLDGAGEECVRIDVLHESRAADERLRTCSEARYVSVGGRIVTGTELGAVSQRYVTHLRAVGGREREGSASRSRVDCRAAF